MSWTDWWPVSGGATEEGDTGRDGFISYSGEVHAVGNGFAKGFAGREMTATARDSKRETHYFRGGYVVGRLAQLAIAAIGAATFL